MIYFHSFKVEEEKLELSDKISELSVALQQLRSEKESMELELELKNKEIEELKSAKEELERGLESAEVDKRQERERQKHRVEQLETEAKEEAERRTKQLDDLQEQLEACRQRELYLEGKSIETEAAKESMKALLAETEADKNHLQTLLEELQTGRDGLCAPAEAWKSGREDLKIDVTKAGEPENPNTALLSEKEGVRCSPASSLEQESRHVEEKENLAGGQGQQQLTGASVQEEFETCKLSVAKLNEQVHTHTLLPRYVCLFLRLRMSCLSMTST